MRTKALFCMAFGLVALPLSGKEQIPPVMLQGLTAEDFSIREKSQKDLLQWTAEKSPIRAALLLDLTSGDDPEIRKRSSEILRKLSDEDYMSEGQGYLGILLAEEMLKAVDPNAKPGVGIRINMVMRDSPADKAGLKVGDLIIALDGASWKEVGAMNMFMEAVAKKKPLTDVVLSIRRGAKEPIEITVKLGKRPVVDLQNSRGDLQMLDQQAKEKHYAEWLKQLKSEHK